MYLGTETRQPLRPKKRGNYPSFHYRYLTVLSPPDRSVADRSADASGLSLSLTRASQGLVNMSESMCYIAYALETCNEKLGGAVGARLAVGCLVSPFADSLSLRHRKSAAGGQHQSSGRPYLCH